MRYPLPPDFHVPFDALEVAATGMQRPECVLALASGELVASDARGGVRVIDPSGSARLVVARSDGEPFRPNGIDVAPDGRVLFANLGEQRGGIFGLDASGRVETIVADVDGMPLPPACNYVMIDAQQTLWFTVSTRLSPRYRAWNARACDGFIGVKDARGPRIVADGLGYTNEIALSPDSRWLYVNETFAQRVSRFALRAGPKLGPRETVVQLDGADLPDGLTFDEAGGLWLTCLASNRVIVVRPNGELQVVLDDCDPVHAARIETGIRNGTLQPSELYSAGRSRLGNISSLAFGGPDRRTAYLGCLLDDRIRSFATPVTGLARAHWGRSLFAS